MTCIAAAISPKTRSITMGADSAGSVQDELRVRLDPKMRRVGEYLIGFSGSYRAGQLALYGFEPTPPPEVVGDLMAHMVTDFIDDLAGALDRGASNRKVEGTDESPAEFLVGVRGRLFHIEHDFQICELSTPYAAIGSGAQVAMGAFYALADDGAKLRSDEEMVRIALEAAEKHVTNVSSPFLYETLGRVKLAVL